jgi:hypothetical protein
LVAAEKVMLSDLAYYFYGDDTAVDKMATFLREHPPNAWTTAHYSPDMLAYLRLHYQALQTAIQRQAAVPSTAARAATGFDTEAAANRARVEAQRIADITPSPIEAFFLRLGTMGKWIAIAAGAAILIPILMRTKGGRSW